MTQAQTMTAYEMTEQLAQKTQVSLEEAKAALEAGEWNVLTATHILEQEKFRRMQALNEVAQDSAEPAAQQPRAEEAPREAAGKAARAARAEARRARHSAGLKRIGRAIMDLIALGNRSRFAIHKGGDQLLAMPVTVLAALLLFSFGTCAVLLLVGLFLGCRYSVNGRVIGAGA